MTVARSPRGGRATVVRSGTAPCRAPPRACERWGAGGPSSAEALEHHRHALAAADAHGLQPEGAVLRLQTVEQRAGDAGAGHAERVADGDRAAVHVQLVDVDAQVAVARDDLRGEGLVDLDEV